MADILIVLTVLLLTWPLFLIIACLIKGTSKGPVIFSQTRIGLLGRPFKFHKFRSMYMNADLQHEEMQQHNQSADGVIFKMRNDPRITPIGRILRKYSLDELPQLYNVLRGDMSLVGPRPPLPREVSLYTDAQRKRLDVLPGITCLWQISGRSELPFTMQCQLDLQYIANRSLWGDLKILLGTIPAIISGKGAW